MADTIKESLESCSCLSRALTVSSLADLLLVSLQIAAIRKGDGAMASLKINKYKDAYALVQNTFSPAIVSMPGKIHIKLLRLL